MDNASTDMRNAHKPFSRIGISLTVFGAVTFLAQLGLIWVLNKTGILADSGMYIWVVSFIPQYFVAFPICTFIMTRIPGEAPAQNRLGVGRFFLILVVLFPMMYAGNIVGTLLSSLISGGTAQNALLSYAMDNSIIKVIVMVILAPLIEEFIFRKLIIDRTWKYGERVALLLSGLTFGLFHMNLYQFFYAFLLGIMFAYVYIRTGKLYYSVLMHAIINFFGSVIAPAMLSLVDPQIFMQMDSGDPQALLSLSDEALTGFLAIGLYGLGLLALCIVGIILLIMKRKTFQLHPVENELPKKGRLKTVYLNAGMILFILFTLGMTVLNIFSI